MKSFATASLLAALLAGCGHPLEPSEEIDLSKAVKIAPSAQYIAWWNELEACSGLSGNIHAVSFYVLPNDTTVRVGNESYWGYWIEAGDRIVFAGPWAANEKLVKHEEMHALLQSPLHPAAYFQGPCGDLAYPEEG